MKPKRLIAMAIAGSLALSAGALAGGKFQHQRGAEVQSPPSVSESGSSLESIGASSSMSGSGSVGYDASSGATTEYWHMGGDADVGVSSDTGASGRIDFSSSPSPTNDKPPSD